MSNPLYEIYIQETEENLLILEDRVIGIEDNPDDKEIINEAFRAIHSIKGGAGLAGFTKIKDFTHIVEDLFELLRNGSLTPDKDIVSVSLKTLDVLKIMLDNIKREEPEDSNIDTSELKAIILEIISNANGTVHEQKDSGHSSVQDDVSDHYYYLELTYYPDIFKSGIDPGMFISDLKSQGQIVYLHLNQNAFPIPEQFSPDTLYLSWNCFYKTSKTIKEIEDIFCFVIDESNINIHLLEPLFDNPEVANLLIDGKAITDFVEKPKKEAKVKEGEDESVKYRRSTDLSASSFIRVQTEKLEKIFNTVSELIISQAHLNLLADEYSEQVPEEFLSVADTLKESTRVLQEQVTSLRMMSLSSTFDRFKRVVRDIAIDLGKQVHLEISGQDTELDKNMIEKLNDPLKHIVRNSIDHGIETEQDRIALGKNPIGLLKLSAYIEDGKVIIEIEDDGKGVDREKLLEKAIEREIIKDSDNLTEAEVLNLIFHPGLSTAPKITDLSGRGVGMDVVKNSIRDLNGNIVITSSKNVGTCIKLHLPLTLAILDGMLVDIGAEKYIIPTLSILEIFRPLEEHIKTISGRGEVVFFRGDYIPMIRLHKIFHINNALDDVTKAELIVINSVGIKAALLVDNVLEQFQVVLKSLQKNFRKIENISSATILGNGDVALIVDIQNIVHNYATKQNV
ncbi:chemotaxis protein CheA [Spirochaeta cellobiosiphila]|uniref:chemotaxis protein CheA n=1 Tax=Spirochaeta cellobiosiphila TaxID=504483 RepID=UPI00041EEE01|nr:chemotaxis protein CheA [Spirochaeta cellobiosiphila]